MLSKLIEGDGVFFVWPGQEASKMPDASPLKCPFFFVLCLTNTNQYTRCSLVVILRMYVVFHRSRPVLPLQSRCAKRFKTYLHQVRIAESAAACIFLAPALATRMRPPTPKLPCLTFVRPVTLYDMRAPDWSLSSHTQNMEHAPHHAGRAAPRRHRSSRTGCSAGAAPPRIRQLKGGTAYKYHWCVVCGVRCGAVRSSMVCRLLVVTVSAWLLRHSAAGL